MRFLVNRVIYALKSRCSTSFVMQQKSRTEAVVLASKKKVGYVRNIVCAGVQSIAKTNGKEVGSASMPMTRLRANSSYSRVRGHLLFSFPFSFDIFRFCPSPLSQAAEGQAPNAQ